MFKNLDKVGVDLRETEPVLVTSAWGKSMTMIHTWYL